MTVANLNQPTLEARGATVPKLGFGTWQITGDDCVEAVGHALELGYRHIDTRPHDDEARVGRAIGVGSPRSSGPPSTAPATAILAAALRL